MASSSIHKGHRQRMKERFVQQGLDGFTDIQALELLLYYAIPQKDTNPLAHELLDHFGSLPRVMMASQQELIKIPGISDHAATLIRLVVQMNRQIRVKEAQVEYDLSTTEGCGEYLWPYFFGRTVETVFLLCLDAKAKPLQCRMLGEGGVNSAHVSLRKIVETAINERAASVVLAHNHTSDISNPSEEDVKTTRHVSLALSQVDVMLSDHLVFCSDCYFSINSGSKYTKG